MRPIWRPKHRKAEWRNADVRIAETCGLLLSQLAAEGHGVPAPYLPRGGDGKMKETYSLSETEAATEEWTADLRWAADTFQRYVENDGLRLVGGDRVFEETGPTKQEMDLALEWVVAHFYDLWD